MLFSFLNKTNLMVSFKKGMSDKMSKQVEAQIAELNAQLEESQRNVQELNGAKAKLQNENADIARQLEEAESRINQFGREKANLLSQLEEAKRSLEEESRVRFKSDMNIALFLTS